MVNTKNKKKPTNMISCQNNEKFEIISAKNAIWMRISSDLWLALLQNHGLQRNFFSFPTPRRSSALNPHINIAVQRRFDMGYDALVDVNNHKVWLKNTRRQNLTLLKTIAFNLTLDAFFFYHESNKRKRWRL